MGIENPVHLIFIGIVALLVLGPKRLPEVARALGHGLREFREAVSQQGEAPQSSAAPAPVLPPLSELPSAQPQEPAQVHAAGETLLDRPKATSEMVDPAQPVRSEDAPDRGPL